MVISGEFEIMGTRAVKGAVALLGMAYRTDGNIGFFWKTNQVLFTVRQQSPITNLLK